MFPFEICDKMEKLECLKELKTKLSELNDLNTKIKESIFIIKTNEQVLQKFQKEKHELLEERLHIVETLKSINGDLNSIDTVIKETKDDSAKNFEALRTLNQKSKQTKSDADKLRSHIGLPILEEDNSIEAEINEVEKLPNALPNDDWSINDTLRENNLNSGSIDNLLNKTSSPKRSSISSNPLLSAPINTGGIVSGGLNFGQHHSSANTQKVPDNITSNLLQDKKLERSVSSFYQQPPPMKTCLSCQQQIHRNAPICPYCKAKSRSRHPRKPKRKLEN